MNLLAASCRAEIQPQSSMGQIIWLNIRHNHLFKKLVQKIISGWTILLDERIFSKAKAYLQKISEFQMESKATQVMVMFNAMVNISIALKVHKGNVYFHTYYLFSMYVKLT